MSGAPFRVALLGAEHNRSTFDSGSAPLNRYLREQASQDMRRRVAACFVAMTDEQRIAGYCTLASASMLLTALPATTAKKLPRYPAVPAVRMGRWAIDEAFQGRGLGAALLADALERALQRAGQCDRTRSLRHRHHGGRLRLPESAERMRTYIPLGRIAQPQEIQGLALLLASPASSYMTGAIIPIDGGASAR